ncbi:MAG: hypothetical protein Fues2KO_29580 [Fuerstiella sp.]
MIYWEVLAWSVLRAVSLSIVALPPAVAIHRQLRHHSGFGRRTLLVLSLLPLFVPDLVIGFTYRLTASRLMHSAIATELLYAGLLLFRLTAFQLAVLLLMPVSGVSDSSVHSWNLIPRRDPSWWLMAVRLRMQGPWRPMVVGVLAGVLIGLQEFETAALVQVDQHPIALSVWLFDAHAGGENLLISLRYVATTVLLQLALLVPAFRLLPKGEAADTAADSATAAVRSWTRLTPVLFFVIAGILTLVVWPVWSNAAEALIGFKVQFARGELDRRLVQVLTSLLPSALAAVLSLLAAAILLQSARRWVLACAVVPGLCGSLFISLLLLGLFQLPGFRIFYDTSLPMILGMFLFALPRAVLLAYVLRVLLPQTSRHSLTLLKTAQSKSVRQQVERLWWRFVEVRWLIAAGILTHWCFWDVAIVSNLRPVRFEPTVLRLYSEMHWGRSEDLLATTFLAAIAPVFVCAVAAAVWRAFAKRRRR